MTKQEPMRDEKNRAIAEWLGFKQLPATSTSIPWIIWPDGHRENSLHLPDVFTSEEASALALEKMRFLFHTNVSLSRLVKICIKVKTTGRHGGRSRLLYAENTDRKTAIAEAAYLCAMQEKTK